MRARGGQRCAASGPTHARSGTHVFVASFLAARRQQGQQQVAKHIAHPAQQAQHGHIRVKAAHCARIRAGLHKTVSLVSMMHAPISGGPTWLGLRATRSEAGTHHRFNAVDLRRCDFRSISRRIISRDRLSWRSWRCVDLNRGFVDLRPGVHGCWLSVARAGA